MTHKEYSSNSDRDIHHNVSITTVELAIIVQHLARTAAGNHYDYDLTGGVCGDMEEVARAKTRLQEIAKIIGYSETIELIKCAIAEVGQRVRRQDFEHFLTCGKKPPLISDDLEADAEFLAGVLWAQLRHQKKYRYCLQSWTQRLVQEMTPNEYGAAPKARRILAALRAIVSPEWLEREQLRDQEKIAFIGERDDPIDCFFDSPWQATLGALEEERQERLKQDANGYAEFLLDDDNEGEQ